MKEKTRQAKEETQKKREGGKDCYAKFMEQSFSGGYHTSMDTEKQSTFRHNLAALRYEKQLTQEQLAEILGVSRMAVAKWEAGLGMPNLKNLILLRRFFGRSIDELLFEEQQGKENEK